MRNIENNLKGMYKQHEDEQDENGGDFLNQQQYLATVNGGDDGDAINIQIGHGDFYRLREGDQNDRSGNS